MRLDIIKHRRVSLLGDNSKEHEVETLTENISTVIAPDEIASGSLRERRKGKAQCLRIFLNPPTASFLPSGGSLDWPPIGSPFSAEWRPTLGDNIRTSEQINRWIANGDIQQLESLLLSGHSNLLLGSEYKENFIYGDNRSKRFIADLAEYKEKYEQFLEAIVNGDEIIIRQLIDYRHLVQSRHPRTHTTTIHLSVIFERPTILHILLEKDCSLIDSRDAEGRTPLHYGAALAGTLGSKGLKSDEQSEEFNNKKPVEEEECFDILLDFGANEALLDVEGYTPMNFHRSPNLLDMHQIRGLNQFPIRLGDHIDELIAQRNVKALREIVLAGDYKSQIEGRIFPPECRDLAPTLAHLQTRILAIHEAIRNKDQRTLKQLIDSWDTAIGKDEYGRTPLHIAVLYGRARMARYLLLLFPRCVDIPDKAQRTSLHYASCLPDEHQRAQMTRILYRAGADISTNKEKNNKNIINIKKSKKKMEKKIKENEKMIEQLPDIENEILSSSDDNDCESIIEEDLDNIMSRNGWRINRINNENKMGGNEELINDPFSDGEESVIDEEIEKRVLSIDFNQKQYRQLEQLHFEGLGGKVWKIIKKHLGNEKLIKYIYAYRQAQNRLSQVFGAIELNDLKKLKTLLDEEIVQIRDIRGLTPLHIAVLEERHEIVEFIATQFPLHINISDYLGRTVAHYAAPQQNAIYDTLADLGADVKICDKNGFSAEHYRANPKQMVHPLPFLGNEGEKGGEIKLNKIQINNNNRGFLSLQKINNINNQQSMDEDGYFILDPDAPSDEQIQKWLSLGDVQQLEQLVLDGRAYLLKDKSSTNLASAEFLQGVPQYQSKVESIHKAVEEGDVRRVKSLIDRTMLATAKDSHGMTPLHKALLYGQTITVRFLLTKYPHCVNEPDHAGRTALHFAAADSNGEHMIKVLQKAGGDAFIEDKYGHTPFYYRTHGKRLNIRTLKDNAVINQLISGQLNRPLLQDLEEDITDWIHTGNIGKLEELVLNGYADLLLGRNHQLDDADSISFLEVLPQYQAKVQAIHKAIEQGNLRAVKLLTDRKKLAFCRDNRGLAPLHKAVVFGQTEIAKYLIRNYPQSVNSMDQSKRTPLHYSAALRDGGYMYKLMRKAGADPNTFDCNGRLPKYYLKYPGELNLERMRLDTKQALKQILHTRVAPSYLETNIQQWLREGNLAKLDQLVMSGCGDLVLDKKSNNPEAQIFLRELPSLLENIDQIHKSIREGRIELVKQLITNKRLALARDKHGCTPLHTAIIHERTEIIRFLAANFPLVLNAPDYNKRTAMHYAAAARDGGHYLKILGKAGADPMAVDNEGRTPDYYRRNAVFDLKMLKERDVEELSADTLLSKKTSDDYSKNNYNEEFDHQHDSLSESADLLSLHSSGFDTERKINKGVGEEYIDGEINEYISNDRIKQEEEEEEESEDIEKNKFEHLLHERLGMPTSDNGLYLARTVAPILTKALAEVLLRRPANPISFITDWLVKYNEENDQF